MRVAGMLESASSRLLEGRRSLALKTTVAASCCRASRCARGTDLLHSCGRTGGPGCTDVHDCSRGWRRFARLYLHRSTKRNTPFSPSRIPPILSPPHSFTSSCSTLDPPPTSQRLTVPLTPPVVQRWDGDLIHAAQGTSRSARCCHCCTPEVCRRRCSAVWARADDARGPSYDAIRATRTSTTTARRSKSAGCGCVESLDVRQHGREEARGRVVVLRWECTGPTRVLPYARRGGACVRSSSSSIKAECGRSCSSTFGSTGWRRRGREGAHEEGEVGTVGG
ncbi:hypothetical protein K438DRAFT_901895 [Mycena galopus ATCC 62051]|nr:hypothetical protein K438DRAFT_901895 [Mycena galopus ATCC 62051]